MPPAPSYILQKEKKTRKTIVIHVYLAPSTLFHPNKNNRSYILQKANLGRNWGEVVQIRHRMAFWAGRVLDHSVNSISQGSRGRKRKQSRSVYLETPRSASDDRYPSKNTRHMYEMVAERRQRIVTDDSIEKRKWAVRTRYSTIEKGDPLYAKF